MTAIERLRVAADLKKVNDWLDRIQEHDPACRKEVLDMCEKDPEARAFYVAKYEGML